MALRFANESGINRDCKSPESPYISDTFEHQNVKYFMISCNQVLLTRVQLKKCEGCNLNLIQELKLFTKNESGRLVFHS